jgi:L-threonylcarbamoyladenylate synthase
LNDSNCSIPRAPITHETARAGQANTAVATHEIERAVQLLRAGDVVGMPTETVYGLAGDGFNPAALARIFEIKRRPLYDPLILHFAGADAAFAVACDVPEQARKLAARFWPGPLTLVLPKRDTVPDLATSGLPKVAVRVPAHPVAQALLRAFGGPLAAPSANRFGRISPTDAAAVRAELGDAVPLILDGGPCAVGLESTVLEVGDGTITLLRAGGISVEEIERAAGMPVARATPVDDTPVAPGQLRHHYAPRKALRLLDSGDAVPHSPGAGLLAFGPITGKGFNAVENLSPTGNLREAAANFFRALRALDDDPCVEAIYAAPVPQHGLGLAINERLERASAR